MSRVIFLAACYLGFTLSSLLVCFLGSSGWKSYRSLEREAERLRANVKTLRQVNVHLTERLQSLESRPETVRLLARDLGYFAPGEQVIHIDTYGVRPTFYRVGTLVREPVEMQRKRESGIGGTFYFLPLLLLITGVLLPWKHSDDAGSSGRVGSLSP